MEDVLFIIIMILLFLIILLIGAFIISYLIHVDMTKEQNLPYDYVNFTTFLDAFRKYKDNPNVKFGVSKYLALLFYDKNGKEVVCLYYNVVKIDGKCMIFKPLSWIIYSVWIRQLCRMYMNIVLKG